MMTKFYIRVTSSLERILRKQAGAEYVEYAMITAILGIGMVLLVTLFGNQLQESYLDSADKLFPSE
ncbi:MAG: hypothetical protein KDD42_06415 [Bdellovibrionales bacterium]|nr:hypothetical protein [Bdellovibrionales bacterium]